MFLDLEFIDSHLTLIICIIAIFTPLKALWRRAWEHGRGEEAEFPKAGRHAAITLVQTAKAGIATHQALVIAVVFISEAQIRRRAGSDVLNPSFKIFRLSVTLPSFGM